jgi:hypothetical protein
MESEWSEKIGLVEHHYAVMSADIEKLRADITTLIEKLANRESKITALFGHVESAKKVELVIGDMKNRISKLDGDIMYIFDELKRLEGVGGSGNGGDGLSLPSLESKIDLVRSESKSHWERVARQVKQDLDSLRVKIERISIVRDEYDRLSNEVSNLHDMVVGGVGRRAESMPSLISAQPAPNHRSFDLLSSSFSPSPPPLLGPHGGGPDSSLLSVVDEGIGSAHTQSVAHSSSIVHKILTTRDEGMIGSISVPSGGSEMGTLKVDVHTNRLIWRIENMAFVLRDPHRFPKIFVSPEFASFSPTNDVMIARLKLFPTGSDQSRIDGCCSFYLRCVQGLVVRFSVDVAGELVETFECEYEKQRDKGKHDFIKLNEVIEPDGSITIGIDVRSIRQIQIGAKP